jgi:UrcA family protein
MTRLSPFALAGALIATSLTVLSAVPVQANAMRVRYGDLDLTSAAGRAVMNDRIHRAAIVVCNENRDLSLAAACRKDSIDRAHADLDRAIDGKAVQMAAR